MSFELLSHGLLAPGSLAFYGHGSPPQAPISTAPDVKYVSPGEARLRSKYHIEVYKKFDKAIKDIEVPQHPYKEKKHVGIIGAGMSGLFSALILKGIGIDVTVYEVNGRVGGRVHTDYFDKKEGDDGWQYGEYGAMRLPRRDKHKNLIKEHELVFNVIEYLNKKNQENHSERNIELIPFIFSSNNGITYYNNKMHTNSEASARPSELGFPQRGTETIKDMWNNACDPFLNKLKFNFDEGLKNLLEFDEYSVREYLRRKKKLEEIFISSIETFSSATGLFRLAFSEAIIDAYTFEAAEWKTIKGGMERFPNAFIPSLEGVIKYKHSVQKLKNLPDEKVEVTFAEIPDNNHQFPPWNSENGENFQTETFDHVIVTCPLGVVRRWDLPEFSFNKRMAIRTLNYDNSAKIFLQFKTRFWEKIAGYPIKGGSSSTDLPIRTIVYPSYGVGSDGPGVLLVSYTWANDAARFGANSDEDVAELALRDLVKIHGQIAREQYTGQHGIHYWSVDPIAGGGAFALFEPGQFKNWVEYLKYPEFNIYFAGEHTDVHHAWIVGALNSALFTTYHIAKREGLEKEFEEFTRPFILIDDITFPIHET